MRNVLFLLLFINGSVFAQPYGLEQRQANTNLLIASNGEDVSGLELLPVFTNLEIRVPIFLTHANDGSDRIFVVGKRGLIVVFDNDINATEFTNFLDIQDRVDIAGSETGLLGLAFHPNYAENGKFYVHYNYYTNETLYSRISEFQVTADPDIADPSSERILIDFAQPATNHNGGMIAFGPDDGYLYIAFGDGGGSGDRYGNAQDRRTMMGAILRIDVDNQDDGKAYAIPTDNPLYDDHRELAKEIYAWGLRNPWRFSFDNVTGRLWCADVGQNAWEEIDIIKSGGNYGWNLVEGLHCYLYSNCDPYEYETPVFEYHHTVGNSVTGGYVYRGTSLPQLDGFYLFGDYVSRRIWALNYDFDTQSIISSDIILTCPSNISSFGQDQDGEIYVVGFDGLFYKLVARQDAPPPGNVPATISASKLYSDINNRTINTGIIPYTVSSKLWSDNALKERFIALPNLEQVDFSQDGIFDYPASTVLVKNFILEMEKGNAASRKLIETRFLVKRQQGDLWDGFSYEWNESGTDATLLTDSKDVTFTITDANAPGGQYDQVYHYPSRGECLTCHVPATGFVLGFKTSQLNSDHDYNGITDNQLRTLNHISLFTTDIGEDYHNFPQLVDPLDEGADLTERARSYLDANCAFCHQPQSTGRANMDMRYTTSLQDMNMVDVVPEYGDVGSAEPARILPGDPENSILYLRMTSLDENRMPPIATNLVDENAAQIMYDWITSLDSGTVPVTLTLFNASAKQGHIMLTWIVQSAFESYGFEIERYNGHVFTSIGFVKSQTSNQSMDYSFTDQTPLPGENRYRLKMVDNDGSFEYSAELRVTAGVPNKHRLLPNHPNPFNASTVVRYELAQQTRACIKIYNILGSYITTLVDEQMDAGYHKVTWNGTDANSLPVSSGLYIIELRAGTDVQRIKTTLIK